MQKTIAPIPLYLMAKAPVSGAVKTRMQPQLDRAQSVQLAHVMLQQSARNACRHWRGEVSLCALPQPTHPAFRQLLADYPLAHATQRGENLGARMLQALKQGIARAGCAAVIGCDVPHCPGDILLAAHAMLARGENPVGPTEDGGFYLLGLQRAEQTLFNGVQWGGGDEWAAVRARASAVGMRFAELPRLRDIDRYADLQWLAEMDSAYQQFVS